MIYPSMSTLLDKINSRYLLVNAIARRARQVAEEAEEAKLPLEKKAVTIAIEDIAEDKYSIRTELPLY